MTRIAIVAGLGISLACLAPPALAKGEIPFEKAKGWTIERSAPGGGVQTCLMSKSYRDPDDGNAENGVIFILAGGKAFVTLAYEKWAFDKDDKVPAAVMLDKRVVIPKSTWTGDGPLLTTALPDTIVPNMLAAKTMVLKFDDGKADFDLAGFPEAYESLRRCDATPATVQAVPPQPTETQYKALYLGTLVEAVIKECDVPTTGKQRAALSEKLAVLRKAAGPAEARIQSEIDTRQEPRCPPSEETPKLVETMQTFIDKSLEDFIASEEKRVSEGNPAKPKP